MCGIAGLTSSSDDELVLKMLGRMKYRGPDDTNVISLHGTEGRGHGTVLGVNRLAIIDPERGRQPATTKSGKLTLVFNGEIYNHPELRARLESDGVRLRTRSDTEVIAEYIELYGRNGLRDFHGMFAIAWYDLCAREVYLARDHLGIKPLFVATTKSGFAFASEISALIAHPEISREIDLRAVIDFHALSYIPAPRTIYLGVRKVPPGTMMIIGDGYARSESISPRTPDLAPATSYLGRKKQLYELLAESVREQLISDVPLGLYLSGGVDSSALAYLANLECGVKLPAFTIGYREDAKLFDETNYAKLVCNALGLEHRVVDFDGDFLTPLAELVRAMGEPHGNSSDVSHYLVAKAARDEGFKVLLSGTGADELFAGYPRQLALTLARRFEWIPSTLRFLLMRLSSFFAESTSGDHRPRRAKQFLRGFCKPERERLIEWLTYFHHDEAQAFSGEFRARIPEYDHETALRLALDGIDSKDIFETALELDMRTWLPDNMLQVTDRASMLASVEVRVPYLGERVVGFARSLPWTDKISGFRTKRILKDTFADILPAEITSRAKQGFTTPMSMSLASGELGRVFESRFAPEKVSRRGFYNCEFVRSMLDRHRSEKRDFCTELWSMLVLDMFMES
ncbi:MAG: asparagine synthase (glutamine-hydrolyzing) [Planctomycetes bacterium]|nr:asparagine synthase (glutamine-hydrolyzing) [Planctomycetota bacterium]